MDVHPDQLAYFNYELATDRIAQSPVEPRDAARLLVDRGVGKPIGDYRVADVSRLLEPGDLVVVNDTKVLAARLLLRKPTGGQVEVFLLEPLGDERWHALVRPGRRVQPDTKLLHGDQIVVTVGGRLDGGLRLVTLESPEVVSDIGQVPLPPYITETLADAERYQTVVAKNVGSVAAPTAGLHFTGELCQQLEAAGIGLAAVELQVGLGTFRPIEAKHIADHVMHDEAYIITPNVWGQIQQTRARGGRVVAVGTTVVRALESAAITGALAGRTELFITRDHKWQLVDCLLTNFHQPRSSLLVLVDSFTSGRWKKLYAHALESGYRFLSFGDAMLLQRQTGDQID